MKILFGLLFVFAAALFFVNAYIRYQLKPTNDAVASANVPPLPDPMVEFARAIALARTLQEAIDTAKPMMSDVGVGAAGPSVGALALASWMSHNPGVQQMRTMPVSGDTYAETMKDSDVTRGRLMCFRGKVIEIARDKTRPFMLYVGGLIGPDGKIVRFLAPGPTEGILENSLVRFCGIVAGTIDYLNSGAGTSHGVQAVGYFWAGASE